MTPLRGVCTGFASIVMDTLPFPVPAGEDTWSHTSAVDAVHEHPGVAVTDTAALPPAAPICAPLLLRSNRHGAGSCATVTR